MKDLIRKYNSLSARQEEALVLVLALAFALALQGALIVGKFQGHPTGLFHLGKKFQAQGPSQILYSEPFIFTEENGLGVDGYDGQFFFYLAHDPFIRHGVERFMDVATLRERRIGYPLLAWAAAFGNPRFIPATLYLINLAALLGCVALLGRRAWKARLPYALGLLFVVCASTSMALCTMTCEIVATFFLLLAMTCFEKKRLLPMFAATLMAILTKEICLMWVAALMVHLVYKLRWKPLLGCLMVVLIWGLWVAYVGGHFRKPAPPTGLMLKTDNAPTPGFLKNPPPGVKLPTPAESPVAASPQEKESIILHRLRYFSIPLMGAVENLFLRVQGKTEGKIPPGKSIIFHIAEVGVMLTLLAMAIRGIVRFRRKSLENPAAILFLIVGLCAISMKADIWWWSGNFARQLFILIAVALWFLPRSIAARGDLYGHAGASLLKLASRFLPSF